MAQISLPTPGAVRHIHPHPVVRELEQAARGLGREAFDDGRPDGPPVGDVPHPKQRDPRDVEDSNYRKAYGSEGRRPWGAPLRAAFYAYLPDVPRTRYLPANFAQNYLAKIRVVQEMQCWSRKERERLRQLERRWERRAAGKDARYNACGTAAGLTNRDRTPNPTDRIQATIQELERIAGPARRGAFTPWKPS